LPTGYYFCNLSREATLQSGTGLRKINFKNIVKEKNISEFILDEKSIKVDSVFIWLWIAIEAENKKILTLSLSTERNTFVAERFLSSIVKSHGKHPLSTDRCTCWYPS
jgi:putative transposase